MLITGTTTPLGHIRERRQRDGGERTIERRASSDERVRMIRKFKGMGVKKVQAMLSQEGFGNETGAARHWLVSQEGGRNSLEEGLAGGWGLKLGLAVAVGSIVGALLFFAL